MKKDNSNTKTTVERPLRAKLTKEEVIERIKSFRNERSGSLPLLERVRVEVYLPDPHLIEYDNLLRSFESAPKARHMKARGKREAKRARRPWL